MKKLLLFGAGLIVIVLIVGAATSKKSDEAPVTPVAQSPGGTNVPPATSGTPDFSKLTPQCFVPDPKNPILKQGDLVGGATWNDPHIIKVGSQYVMYSSADQLFDQKIKVYRLVSDDGVAWTLSPSTHVFEGSSDPNAWDHKNAETPAVVFFKGKYYLFYTGYPVSYQDVYSYKIGYATSPDGIHWTRAAAPIVAPTDPRGQIPNLDFNQWLVGEPAPAVFNDKLYLYFSAVGADAGTAKTLQTIGMIISSDGVNWNAAQKVLVPDQKLYPRNDGWIGYSTPHAAVLGGKMHLFIDVANENPTWKQVKIHHAVSSDGLTGWTQDARAIFDRSDFAWTKEEIRSPAVYLEGNRLMLWFAGHKDSTSGLGNIGMGIGLATCNL